MGEDPLHFRIFCIVLALGLLLFSAYLSRNNPEIPEWVHILPVFVLPTALAIYDRYATKKGTAAVVFRESEVAFVTGNGRETVVPYQNIVSLNTTNGAAFGLKYQIDGRDKVIGLPQLNSAASDKFVNALTRSGMSLRVAPETY